ncbi:MAG: hypothetical protein EBR82_62680 [Caulobacteraceae bacterium]|nr:hypothetical protein [Caulobacteraceae bacterium]
MLAVESRFVAKKESKDRVEFQAPTEMIQLWQDCAKMSGLSLSAWIRMVCNQAVIADKRNRKDLDLDE